MGVYTSTTSLAQFDARANSSPVEPGQITVQRLSPADFTTLTKPGIRSEQIVWPENAPDALVTITRVTMEPGATSNRHTHPNSEQTWLVERGTATLLLADNKTEELRAGDVVRTPAGEVHGVTNSGSEPFVYLAVTVPPQDFTSAYSGTDPPT
jgi:quercetin dioxygenase-like cupin family protein